MEVKLLTITYITKKIMFIIKLIRSPTVELMSLIPILNCNNSLIIKVLIIEATKIIIKFK